MLGYMWGTCIRKISQIRKQWNEVSLLKINQNAIQTDRDVKNMGNYIIMFHIIKISESGYWPQTEHRLTGWWSFNPMLQGILRDRVDAEGLRGWRKDLGDGGHQLLITAWGRKGHWHRQALESSWCRLSRWPRPRTAALLSCFFLEDVSHFSSKRASVVWVN